MLSGNIGEKETFRGVSVQTNGFGSNLNRNRFEPVSCVSF